MRNHICFAFGSRRFSDAERILDLDGAAHRFDDAGELGDDRVAPGVHLAPVMAREKLRHDRAVAVQPLERRRLVGRHQGAVALRVGEEDGRELAFHRKGPAVRRPHLWANCGKNPSHATSLPPSRKPLSPLSRSAPWSRRSADKGRGARTPRSTSRMIQASSRSCSAASAATSAAIACGMTTAPSPSATITSSGKIGNAAAADRLLPADEGERGHRGRRGRAGAPDRQAGRGHPGKIAHDAVGDERGDAALLHPGGEDVAEDAGVAHAQRIDHDDDTLRHRLDRRARRFRRRPGFGRRQSPRAPARSEA